MTRAQDAEIQIGCFGPKVPLHPCHHLQPLQYPASSDFTQTPQIVPNGGDCVMARSGDVSVRSPDIGSVLVPVNQRDNTVLKHVN